MYNILSAFIFSMEARYHQTLSDFLSTLHSTTAFITKCIVARYAIEKGRQKSLDIVGQ